MSALEDVNDIDAAAAYLKVPKGTLVGLARRREIGYLKSGRQLTFPREALEAYVESHKMPAVVGNPYGLTESAARRLRAS